EQRVLLRDDAFRHVVVDACVVELIVDVPLPPELTRSRHLGLGGTQRRSPNYATERAIPFREGRYACAGADRLGFIDRRPFGWATLPRRCLRTRRFGDQRRRG